MIHGLSLLINEGVVPYMTAQRGIDRATIEPTLMVGFEAFFRCDQR
jgi:hypothetical protein